MWGTPYKWVVIFSQREKLDVYGIGGRNSMAFGQKTDNIY